MSIENPNNKQEQDQEATPEAEQQPPADLRKAELKNIQEEAQTLKEAVDSGSLNGTEQHETEKQLEKLEIKRYVTENNLEEELSEYKIESMSDKCKVSIVVPSFGEGVNIEKMLKSCVEQIDERGDKISPETFEVVVVVNEHNKADDDVKGKNQETLAKIDELKKKYKEYKIHPIFKSFDYEKRGVGSARKLGGDLALLRSFQRPEDSPDLYIAGTDADTEIDKEWVSKLIKGAESSRDAAYGGGVVYDKNLENSAPEIAKYQRILSEQLRNTLVRALGAGLQGANFAIREDIYAKMNGVSTLQRSEDVENDKKLRELGEKVKILDVNHTTDSRRLLDYLSAMSKNKQATAEATGKYEPIQSEDLPKEKIEMSNDALREYISQGKINNAKYLLENLSVNNIRNEGMRYYFGNEFDEISKMTDDEAQKKLDEIKNNANKYIKAFVKNISDNTGLEQTVKDTVIIDNLFK